MASDKSSTINRFGSGQEEREIVDDDSEEDSEEDRTGNVFVLTEADEDDDSEEDSDADSGESEQMRLEVERQNIRRAEEFAGYPEHIPMEILSQNSANGTGPDQLDLLENELLEKEKKRKKKPRVPRVKPRLSSNLIYSSDEEVTPWAAGDVGDGNSAGRSKVIVVESGSDSNDEDANGGAGVSQKRHARPRVVYFEKHHGARQSLTLES